MSQFLSSLLNVLIVLTSLFLIGLVLIQRGKGGGLAGAFGGAGGSSAFGTKAGDIFTRVTMITALIWIVMLMISVILMNRNASAWVDDSSATGVPGLPAGADKGTSKNPDSEIVPPPPTGVPSPAGDGSKKSTIPEIPVSAGGPSAPLPVTPLPGPTNPPAAPAASPAPKAAETPAAAPKS